MEIADIRRTMSAIYMANLDRSNSSKGIAGRETAMPVVERDRRDIICRYCERSSHIQKSNSSAPSTSRREINGRNGMDSSNSSRGDSVNNTSGSVAAKALAALVAAQR